jgi:hypothetical protein
MDYNIFIRGGVCSPRARSPVPGGAPGRGASLSPIARIYIFYYPFVNFLLI